MKVVKAAIAISLNTFFSDVAMAEGILPIHLTVMNMAASNHHHRLRALNMTEVEVAMKQQDKLPLLIELQ